MNNGNSPEKKIKFDEPIALIKVGIKRAITYTIGIHSFEPISLTRFFARKKEEIKTKIE